MEPANIDWNNLDSKFVEDPLYEHINAPQWLDFSAPLHHVDVDDEAWFCRPDCRHPKTAEDFLTSTPYLEVLTSSDVFEDIPLLRDANLKRRGLSQPLRSSKIDPGFSEDCENQNPNLETPHYHIAKSIKSFFKSSTEKKPADNSLSTEEVRSLKSTLSARNLFAGKDIYNQITEFCHELKKLAMRAGEKEKDNMEKLGVNKSPLTPKREILGELGGKEKERTPLMEVRMAKSKETGSVKGKLRRNIRVVDEENIPISIDLENVKRKGDNLVPIRTYPPSPQCFSATRPPIRATPPKASRSKPMQQQQQIQQEDRGILGEVGQSKEEGDSVRGLDVFWFFKPCTHS